MFDPPEEIERKVKKAVTDTEAEVRYDPEAKPGVSNLLELLGAASGAARQVAPRCGRYGDLKADAGVGPDRAAGPGPRTVAGPARGPRADQHGPGRRGGAGARGGGPYLRRAAEAIGLLAG